MISWTLYDHVGISRCHVYYPQMGVVYARVSHKKPEIIFWNLPSFPNEAGIEPGTRPIGRSIGGPFFKGIPLGYVGYLGSFMNDSFIWSWLYALQGSSCLALQCDMPCDRRSRPMFLMLCPKIQWFLYQTSSSPCKDCHDMGYTWLYHGKNQPIFGGTHGLTESDGTLENPQALLSIAPRR